MKKKLNAGLIATAFIFFMLAPSGFAANKSFSFSVNPSVNDGVAYSAPNPKDDNEQNAYIYTTNHNIMDVDLFYYNVRSGAYPSSVTYTGYFRVTPYNASRIVKSYDFATAYKGNNLYLQADTDRYNVYAEGYWYS